MAGSGSQVLYFYGSDCPVCKTMEPFIDETGEAFEGRVALRKVNVARDQKLAKQYRVMAVPTTVSVSDGMEVTRIVGAKTPGVLRHVFASAETGEVVGGSLTPVDRGLRLAAAAVLAGFAAWTGAWILWILVAATLITAYWDKIRR